MGGGAFPFFHLACLHLSHPPYDAPLPLLRFSPRQQSDPIQLMSWLLNALDLKLKRHGHTVISDTFKVRTIRTGVGDQREKEKGWVRGRGRGTCACPHVSVLKFLFLFLPHAIVMSSNHLSVFFLLFSSSLSYSSPPPQGRMLVTSRKLPPTQDMQEVANVRIDSNSDEYKGAWVGLGAWG